MKLFQNLMKLKDYRADSFFTTPAQLNEVRTTLDLGNASDDDLCNYRDMCVMMWDRFYEKSNSQEIWNAMMSITAIIDNEKYKRGMEV